MKGGKEMKEGDQFLARLRIAELKIAVNRALLKRWRLEQAVKEK